MSATLRDAPMDHGTAAAPAAGEVLFRHRRRPPVLAFALVGAGFAALIGWSSQAPLAQVGCALAAAVLVVLGVLGRRRFWLEDQILARDAALVVRADGVSAEVPYARVARVIRRRSGIVLVRDDGARLVFDRNPHLRRMRPILAERLPDAQWDEEIAIACDT